MEFITLSVAKSIIRKAQDVVKFLEDGNVTPKGDYVGNVIVRAKARLNFGDERKLNKWLDERKVNPYNK